MKQNARDHVGYIYMSKLIVCGEPDELKQMPEVNPPGTRGLDVTCDHVTTALQAVHQLRGRAERDRVWSIDAFACRLKASSARTLKKLHSAVSVTWKFMRLGRRSKMFLSSFRPNTRENNRKPREMNVILSGAKDLTKMTRVLR